MKPIQVMHVDEDEAIRDGIRVLLGTQPDVELVMQADNREEAMRAVEEYEPDVVLMDIHLPDDDGLEIAKAIVARHSDIRVVVYSALADREAEALESGFDFLLKGCRLEELFKALRGR